MGRLVLLAIFIFGSLGCTFVTKRGESGDTPKSAPVSSEQLTQIRIRDLERQLKTQREKELYSKLLPWFLDEDEKLEYLYLANIHEKQEWAMSKKVWNRAKNPTTEMRNLMHSQDIAIGMPMDYVIKSWGEPLGKEVSGNPLFKNQKWKYSRSISGQDGFKTEKRTVYFEGGKVVGWETD